MRSLYVGVLTAMLGILLLSFVIFRAISNHMEKVFFDPVFDAIDELELDDARSVFEVSGPSAVTTYMHKLNHLFGGVHYLLDARGIDVVSGTSKAELLPPPPSSRSRGQMNGQVLVTHRSADGRFWFVAVAPFKVGGSVDWALFPYYVLVAFVAGLLCWLVAAGVISPIRKIATTVASFGRGELDARIDTRRKDEIGQLAVSFNQTADRLQRLIVTERTLLEDISHELRSPLTRLNCAIKLAQASSGQSTALEQIERDVSRMTSLVADIIEITRIEGDPGNGNILPLDLAAVIDEIVDDCLIEAQGRACGIEVQGTPSRRVLGDSELLRRAVENLLRNAIRYSPEHSIVTVSLAETKDSTTIAVRDFGPGVPEHSLTRIFDPFFRVEESRDKDSGGVGLGLSIARRAVQLHHGMIVAENASPGLRVLITLPLLESPVDEHAQSKFSGTRRTG
jgi:signal transduction histidine kinase